MVNHLFRLDGGAKVNKSKAGCWLITLAFSLILFYYLPVLQFCSTFDSATGVGRRHSVHRTSSGRRSRYYCSLFVRCCRACASVYCWLFKYLYSNEPYRTLVSYLLNRYLQNKRSKTVFNKDNKRVFQFYNH